MGVTIPRIGPPTNIPLGGSSAPQLNLPGGRDWRVAAAGVQMAGQAVNAYQGFQADQQRQKVADDKAREEGEKENATAWGVPLTAKAGLDLGAKWYENLGSVPNSGEGLADKTTASIAEIYDPLEQAATTPAAKKLIADARRSAEATWIPKAREKEADTRNAWKASQGEVALNTSIAAVGSAQTPEEVDLLFGQQAVALRPLYDGIADPQARNKAQLDGLQKLADAAYERRQVLGAIAGNEVPPQGVVGPVADAIRGAAVSAGEDPETALVIANLENPWGDPSRKNPKSSARGFFQFTDGTWEAMGGTKADRADPGRQVELGIKLQKQNRAALKAKLGRDPTGGELYLAHQQGLGGAQALLNAGPGMTAIDALTPVYGNRKDATDAVLNNGGSATTTAAAFVGQWQRKFDQAAAGGAVSRLATPEGRKRGDEAAAKVVDEKRKEVVGQLEIAIDAGQATRADLNGYVRAGVIKPGSPEHVRLSKSIQTIEEKAAKEAEAKAERVAVVTGALSGGAPIDPTNEKSRHMVDDDYAERVQTWEPEARETNSIAYANRVGFVPDAMKAQLVGGMRSTDPTRRLASAQLYGRLRATNPSLVNGLPGDVANDAYFLIESQRKGMTPKEAMDALSFAEKLTPEDINVRDQTFTKGLGTKQVVANSHILREMAADKAIKDEKALFGGDFTPPPEMMADVVYLAQRAYRKHGDMEAALSAGYDQARRVWGPSVINGKPVMMKNAPEVIYGIPEMNATDNAKWMRAQAASEFKLDNPKELRFIEAPGITTREGRPAYFVMRETGDGLTQVTQNGKPVAWHPEWQSSPEKAKRDKERGDDNAEKLRVARNKRAREGISPDDGELIDSRSSVY